MQSACLVINKCQAQRVAAVGGDEEKALIAGVTPKPILASEECGERPEANASLRDPVSKWGRRTPPGAVQGALVSLRGPGE